MRKILYIFLLSGFLTSCDSLLDVEPETVVSFDNYFKSELDLETTLYSMQGYINTRLIGFHVQEEAGAFRDYSFNETRSLVQLWNTRTLTEHPGSNWGETYWIVYMANVMLDNIDRTRDQVSADRIDFYIAQAYFAKGLAYFILGQRWGEVPITRNSTSTEVYGKKPVLEVLDTAIANATRACNMLPVQSEIKDRQGNVIASKQFGSKGTACALLANAYAWKGSMIDLLGLEGDSKDCYTKAIAYCTELINGAVGTYSLVRDPQRLCELFSDIDQNNPESIFEFTLDIQRDIITSTCFFASSYLDLSGKHNNYKVSYETIYKIYEKDKDKRIAAFVTPGMNDWGELTGYATLNKWREGVFVTNPDRPYGKGDLTAIKTNYSYWRLSDIYLLRAECNAKMNTESAEAIRDLNEIRGISNATAYPNGPEDGNGLQYAVFKERERELYLEGHRYFDIVRNGMWYINNKLYQGDDGKFQSMALDAVKKGAIFLPIFEDAFDRNDLLRQNDYWAEALNE